MGTAEDRRPPALDDDDGRLRLIAHRPWTAARTQRAGTDEATTVAEGSGVSIFRTPVLGQVTDQ